jgi:Ca2+-binding RTX toxin-like protein
MPSCYGLRLTAFRASMTGTGTNLALTLSADSVQLASLGGNLDSYRFAFDDGTQLNLNQLLFNYRTDPLTIQGDDNDNTLYGGRADDTLNGNGGMDDDLLIGGTRNNTEERLAA